MLPPQQTEINMKTILLLLTLTIGNSYSAPIPINSVPVTISSPGTYQVTSNLVCTAGTPAISVNSAGAGKIIIDLEGFTISAVGDLISGVSIKNPTNSSIIVRNGTLSGFKVGVDVNPAGSGWVSNVHLESLVFLADLQTNVRFYQVNASSVTDCSFVGLPGHSLSIYGIKDIGTQTGNRFVNYTFDGTQAIALSLGGGPVFTNLV
jgi:hypothetical protein